jgi:hypothetical protein
MTIEDSKIVFLNLPPLPVEIEQELINSCKLIPLNENNRQWVDNFHKNELPVAAEAYGLQTVSISDTVQTFVQDYYGDFFPGNKIIMFLGIIKNVLGVPSVAPPHCDRSRNTAINYILETGGDSVRTCFYNELRENLDLSKAENKYHRDVTLDFKTVFPKRSWHAYNVQQYHSVENVEQSRYLFSLKLENNPTFQEFKQKYKNLIADYQ